MNPHRANRPSFRQMNNSTSRIGSRLEYEGPVSPVHNLTVTRDADPCQKTVHAHIIVFYGLTMHGRLSCTFNLITVDKTSSFHRNDDPFAHISTVSKSFKNSDLPDTLQQAVRNHPKTVLYKNTACHLDFHYKTCFAALRS